MDEAADGEGIEAFGRWLFAQRCDFVAGAASVDALPPARSLEIAFAGRSNVGKSSLINALTGRTTLARTSHTPGRTQQLNFFDLAGRLMLVDLPGYGYAAASKAAIARWTRLIEGYLQERTSLARVMVLVDARHGLKASDRQMLSALDAAAVTYQAVLTKIDKLSKPALAAAKAALADELARHPAAHPKILSSSAHSGIGIVELRAELAGLVDQHRQMSERAS